MEIRELGPADIPRFARLIAGLEVAEWTKGRSSPEIEAVLAGRYAAKSASSTILISSTPEGDISGYGSVHWMPNFILPGMEGYVSELFVSAPYRGQGIGDRILKEIENQAVAKGCCRLSLLNLKDRESYRRGFYRKRNWEERANAANLIKKFGV